MNMATEKPLILSKQKHMTNFSKPGLKHTGKKITIGQTQ